MLTPYYSNTAYTLLTINIHPLSVPLRLENAFVQNESRHDETVSSPHSESDSHVEQPPPSLE